MSGQCLGTYRAVNFLLPLYNEYRDSLNQTFLLSFYFIFPKVTGLTLGA